MHATRTYLARAVLAVSLVLASIIQAHAQAPAARTEQSPTAQSATPTAQGQAVFKPEELDQMMAPIALYPDALLAQILMASTYPLEIVQADRWVKQPGHKDLKGEQLAQALEKETWDPSVKSLVPFPQVLGMMNEKLDWTQRLGDAVLAQKKDVMESVQRLRKTAADAGTLKTTEQQQVVVEDQAVVIKPADPEKVYVPVYNPTVVYGSWPYPAYPPTSYYPPPAYYPAGSAFMSGLGFATGVAVVGSIWGWGNCNWHGDDINVNYNKYNTINRENIAAGRATRVSSSAAGSWQFQPQHRGGVAYRDPASRQAYQRTNAGSASARQQYRGFSDTSARPAATGAPQRARSADRGAGQSSLAQRSTTQRQTAQRSTAQRSPAALSNIQSGRSVAAQSSRGQESRLASSSRSAPSSGARAAASSGGRSAAPRGGGGGGGRGGGRR